MMRCSCVSLFLLASACLHAFGDAQPIRVAAAISLKDALADLIERYEADTGQRIALTLGSSGQLMAQIKSGAAIDVFVSAATHQVDELAAAGLIDESIRRVIARNRLVLVVPQGATDPPVSIDKLASDNVGKIAIGEPRTVPAGMYARQMIQKLKLTDVLRKKLVYGANVRQVLDYVARGEVSAGIVYATDARDADSKVKVVQTIDDSMHDPIEYPAVVVKDSPHAASAQQFIEYLASEPAQSALARRGFVTATNPPASR